MTFEQWKQELANALEKALGMDAGEGADYIENTGDDCWREMFDDGLSPTDAADEEAYAAAAMM